MKLLLAGLVGLAIGFGACVALVYVGAPYLFSCAL